MKVNLGNLKKSSLGLELCTSESKSVDKSQLLTNPT